MKTAFVYTDRYFAYDYGAHHPLKINRLRLTYDLCRAYGLFGLPESELLEAGPASEAEILRFHSAEYIDVLKRASRGDLAADLDHGLGPGDNPPFPGLWEWSLLQTGASLECARLVAEGRVRIAFNVAGGLHHATRGRASGFCYLNDPVLAICHFLDRGKRVLYLDIDAHHGDGVQWAFYEDPRVLTVSFHQDGRTLFPGSGAVTERGRGTGSGYAVNVPMLPGTDDETFWRGFRGIVPALMRAYRPDVVVSQLGVDSFLGDPLANLELTTHGFSKVIRFLADEAPAWVALGGGGYDETTVARAWTLAWAIMNGVEAPDEIPEPMRGPLGAAGARSVRLRDQAHQSMWQAQCMSHMDECIRFLHEETVKNLAAP